MSTSRFYKKLTQAEVGQTKTHEVYIRMPNDFDYEKFFNNTHIENGSVIEVNFTAPTVSKKNPMIPQQEYDYRFVFFANSNKEKRIPGLGPLFKAFEVEEGDVVCLERVGEGENVKFAVTFYNAEQVQVSPAAVMITSEPEELDAPQIDTPLKDLPLQVIYFGAPGTGKSHKINKASAKYPTFRTTFHPDTDYASFVGSYKPITIKVPIYGIQGQPIRDIQGKIIEEDRIVYHYVFQAFLQAYIKAWEEQTKEEPQPVFLVIEEINRGNCAQIFGDIFQLLDRNGSGFSDYPIVADKDLAQELKAVLAKLNIAKADQINTMYEGGHDVVGMVKRGEKLLLPNNLYIWATMNTSDQSLFPIDSAFKRRWDWEYIKIKDHSEQGYGIQFSNGNRYDWWQFVTAINEHIEGGEIQQEDKKLGYFFAKTADGTITAKRFLSKVIFYLYTDVFKDFGFDEPFFKDENGETMTFASYFNEEGDPDESRVERFLINLGLKPIMVNEEDALDQIYGLTVNGRKMLTITQAVFEILNEAAKRMTFDAIKQTVGTIFADRDDVVKAIDNPETYIKENRWNKIPIVMEDGQAFVVSNQWHKESIPQVKELAESFNVPFESAVEEYDNEDDESSTSGKRLKYSVNGKGNYGIGEAFLEMSKAIANQPGMTFQKMVDAGKIIRGKAIFLPTESLDKWKDDHINDSKRDRCFFENLPIVTNGDNVKFVVSTQWGKQRLEKIQEFAAVFGISFEQISE